ncbi:MAG: signal peptide peptidase SppA [Tsuneonella sp.]
MSFARKVWGLLVGIKDALSLVFLLLFFAALYAVLTARPSPAAVREGALLLDLDGSIVEEKAQVNPIRALISGEAPAGEYDVQDLVHAIDEAAKDDRIKAIVLDLSKFTGGGQVHIEEVGAALDRFRQTKKPVLAWAVGYVDDGMLLAAHASEVWVDPMGGAMIAGPGGEHQYYGDLLNNLKIKARVYKVGTYKSAVEPYSRSDMSEPARENYTALYGALWSEWQADFKKARPQANLALVTGDPVGWIKASSGDLAAASKAAGLVDRIGDKTEFGNRVARIVGDDPWDDRPGKYAYSELDPWLADKPGNDSGRAIGVITIANEIVDGDAGPGQAGGDRIADLLDDAADQDLAGLVVRVDSPGGSVMASEEIRRAILRLKAKGIPVAVSMANRAASGGYWVSTPGSRIFAEPDTITGSIGIFAVVPTFEDAAANWGIHSDGVRTTPLSGQPDLIAGFTPEVDQLLQSTVEHGYSDFISRVSQSRHLAPARVDEIGQGRVWDGGTARQIGLVDQYGGLPDALAWVARQAKLGEGEWHAEYLGQDESRYDTLLRRMFAGSDDTGASANADLFAMMSARQQALLGKVQADIGRLLKVQGMQAYCLECGAAEHRGAPVSADGWLAQVVGFLARR